MHARNRGNRGSALVLAVLILFAMLGLGMVAMRSATQNIAGAGNLRATKQARYVAEVGLYHAVTLMNLQGDKALLNRLPDQRIRVDSAGAVVRVSDDGEVNVDGVAAAPDLFEGDPPPLGPFAGGLVPSYRVEVDGFMPAGAPAGEEIGASDKIFCRMEFTSRGYIAAQALPTPEQLASADARERSAEVELKASMVLGPYPKTVNCNRSF